MNIRLTRKNRTLRSALKNRKTVQTCSLQNCRITDKSICYRKNVVYKLTCDSCKNFYIGSTTRTLHIRCREHSTNSTSSMYKLLQNCQTTLFSTTIWTQDSDEANLRLREALLINKLNPKINGKSELELYRYFLFV